MESKISIVVPVYNVEKFLNRCVDSLLNQSHRNLEIILINDASSDHSGEICDDYKYRHSNIIVIHRETSGGSASIARNTGLKIVSGKYVAFVDSDDWIHPNMIETLLKVLEDNNTKVAECDIIETSDFYIKPLSEDIDNRIVLEDKMDALKRVINNQRFSVCVRLYEYNLVKNFKFPENVISEDVFFTLEVFKKITNLVRIDEPFYYYFITPNSVTRQSYSLKYFDSLNSGLHLQQYIQETEKDPELLKIVQLHILKKLLYHYKMLNYNPKVDPEYIHRKRLKGLINKNYFRDKKHELYLKLANYLSVKSFEILIYLNKTRHQIFKTNEFS
ncbi:glycosyltransferase [Winogradskyella costae]|uniref:glycosyltransferase n=1 Tax=Winogradskyella costae TaxID=2697008 RepID=UPI0015C8D56E|nr:glycosyltransferase [Winogradskyella costae]